MFIPGSPVRFCIFTLGGIPAILVMFTECTFPCCCWWAKLTAVDTGGAALVSPADRKRGHKKGQVALFFPKIKG